MATRCSCSWESVELDDALEVVLLRCDEVPGCPAHAPVLAGDDTAA